MDKGSSNTHTYCCMDETEGYDADIYIHYFLECQPKKNLKLP